MTTEKQCEFALRHAQPESREKWRGKPCMTRLKAIKSIFVAHSAIKTLQQHIDRQLILAEARELSNGTLVIAPSGAGKSTFIKHLSRIYPDEVHEMDTRRPVVHFKIPKQPNARQMAKAFLKALGDPLYGKGDAGEMMERIEVLIKRCKTRIIAIDDFQDVPARRGALGIAAVGDWVRDILEMPCNCILIALGTEKAVVVRNSNPQLARRMMARIDLPPFSLETAEGQSAFRKLLKQLDDHLPMAEPSKLDESSMVARIFIATGGNFDYLIKLLNYAVMRACERNAESLTLDDFKKGFEDQHQVAARRGNPFDENFNETELNQPGQVFYQDLEEQGAVTDGLLSKGKNKKNRGGRQ